MKTCQTVSQAIKFLGKYVVGDKASLLMFVVTSLAVCCFRPVLVQQTHDGGAASPHQSCALVREYRNIVHLVS